MKSFLKLTIAFACLVVYISGPVHATQGRPEDHVSYEVNVVLQPGVSIDTVNAVLGTTVIDQIPGTSYYRLLTPGGLDAYEAQARMGAYDDDLVSVDPNFIYQQPEIRQVSEAFLDQSSEAFLDGFRPARFFAQPSIINLRLAEAQSITRGAGVTVAVIDTGIDFNHPLFAGRISPTFYDFVDNDFNPTDESKGVGSGHGTFVAGLISLAAPDARIMPLRAFGPDGKATSFNIAKAIRFARDNGATVINMSFGLRERDGMIKDAIDYASASSYLVAAAGNDDLDFLQFPSALNKIGSVASTTDIDLKAPFSNFNSHVHVSAPGVSLYSAYPGGLWAYWTGTSFSAALVSAEAAQLLALNPKLNRGNLDQIIRSSGVSIDAVNRAYFGKLGKRIDYLSAAKSVRQFGGGHDPAN